MTIALACVFAPPLAALAQVQAPPVRETAEVASWTVVDERWYTVEIAGGKAGWSSLLIEEGDGKYRTTSRTKMKIGRGAAPIEIRMDSIMTETTDGKPLRVEFAQNMSTQVMHSTWDFRADNVLHTSKQGGNEIVKEIPLPKGEWLTTMAAERYSTEQRKAGAAEFSFRMLDPQNGVKPIKVTSKNAGPGEAEIDGKKVPVTIWKTMTDLVPLEMIEHYDADFEMVYQEMAAPFGKVVTRAARKEEALAEGGGEVPELLAQTFIKLDEPIENDMKAKTMKLRVSAKAGTLQELPSAGAQRVEMSDDKKSAIVTIDIDDSLPAPSADASDRKYLDATTMVDSKDELVQKLADNADEAGDDLMAKAEALRTIVNRHISRKGMATAFASASETARMKRGDCSEHGVLLCALLRAEDIPARVALGLVYADQFAGHEAIFGWHMWTQALIDGQWVDFDATLPVRYNAAHVLTGFSALDEGLGAEDIAPLVMLIGNLDVEVLEVGYE